jgi:hypothetical protein
VVDAFPACEGQFIEVAKRFADGSAAAEAARRAHQ